MMGIGRVALLGCGKRRPPTGATPASRVDSSEAKREQKRAPREKPAHRIRYMSMQRFFFASRRTAFVYSTSSGKSGIALDLSATLRLFPSPCNTTNAKWRFSAKVCMSVIRSNVSASSLVPGPKIQRGIGIEALYDDGTKTRK